MFVSFVLLLSLTATATENKCLDVAEHCNKLLKESASIIEDQERVIDLQKQEISVVHQNLAIAHKAWMEEKDRANAWYRQPEFTIPMALFAGFVLSQTLRTTGR